jgi:hypothetical protein
VDYLIRVSLRASGLEKRVSANTVRAIDSLKMISGRASRAEAEVLRRIKLLRPAARRLTDEEWRELAALCLVLARFEQYYRTNGLNLTLIDTLLEPLGEWSGQDLDDLIRSLDFGPSIEDLATLGQLAAADYRYLRRKTPLRFNPIFDQSLPLGGADADLIAAGVLYDWKATTTRQVAGRQTFWQLLGYVLADTSDRFGIHSVALGGLRWRTRITWPLDEFLAILADGAHTDLATLRGEFAYVVGAWREAFEIKRTERRAELARMRELEEHSSPVSASREARLTTTPRPRGADSGD